MTVLDFSPLLRSTVGFDGLMGSLNASAAAGAGGFPHYNIVRDSKVREAGAGDGPDRYLIEVAVAGFGRDDLAVQREGDELTISGGFSVLDERHYLHRGISQRGFRRRFRLAENIRVERSWLQDGVLTVALVREVPEAERPRTISIEGR